MAKDERPKRGVGPRVNLNEPPPKGKHDHGTGINPTVGSTYKGKHAKKESK